MLTKASETQTEHGLNPIQLPDMDVFSAAPKRQYLCQCIQQLTLLAASLPVAAPDVDPVICLYGALFTHLVESACIDVVCSVVGQALTWEEMSAAFTTVL